MILWCFLSLQVVPVVDGNVVRVISRLYAISDNPKESSTMKRFWLAALSSPCWQLKELEFILFVACSWYKAYCNAGIFAVKYCQLL
jgi:hypothetical protein